MELTGKIFNIQKFSLNDGPGIRTTVFFKGCPLQCRWCSNPESQNRYATLADAVEDEAYCGRQYSVEQVMDEVRKDKPFYDESGGGLTLSGGEVLQQAAFAGALADAAHSENISVAAETSGYASAERFGEFLGHIDLLLYDFKHCDKEIHYQNTGVHNDKILENLRTAIRADKAVVARIPVIPGFNATIPDAGAMAECLMNLGVREVHLLPFHQFGEKKYKRLGVAYDMAGYGQLHPQMLEEYREAFISRGLDCSFR